MARKAHLQELGANRDALFVSDPTNGDIIIVGTIAKLKEFKIPATAESHEFTTVHDLLNRLDFETYDENGLNLIQV